MRIVRLSFVYARKYYDTNCWNVVINPYELFRAETSHGRLCAMRACHVELGERGKGILPLFLSWTEEDNPNRVEGALNMPKSSENLFFPCFCKIDFLWLEIFLLKKS